MIMNSSIRTSFKATSRIANSRRCGGPPSFHRAYSIPIFANESESKGLDQWLASPPTHTFKDPVSVEHLHDLYITLPTRDGTRRPFVKPEVGMPLPAGHHLAFFHARLPEPDLRKDGTDSEISPPQPFTKRMWAAGKITWNAKNPLVVGVAATGKSGVSNVVRKKWDEGKPMLFVTQRIEFSQDGMDAPAIVEERAHVYFHAKIIENHKKIFDRPVKDIPSTVDFSLKYTPTPVTLFRYSALMFNAHHIHLDKEYCEKEEKYPERLVHGPLTAQMLLETVNFHHPGLQFQSLEYRATNPMFVNKEMTINGKWLSDSSLRVWCQDESGIVGMRGLIEVKP